MDEMNGLTMVSSNIAKSCICTPDYITKSPNIRIVPLDSRSGLYYIESGSGLYYKESGPSGLCYSCPEVCCPNEAATRTYIYGVRQLSPNPNSQFPTCSARSGLGTLSLRQQLHWSIAKVPTGPEDQNHPSILKEY